jgi:ribose/xylose/arabinose/galactoside ABC-type transport system permease subunit
MDEHPVRPEAGAVARGLHEAKQSALRGKFGKAARGLGKALGAAGPSFGVAVVLAFFVILIGVEEGPRALRGYLSLRNFQVTVSEVTITGVVALGSLLVIISGGIDLSVGSVVALVTVVTMKVYTLVYHQTGGSIAQASLVAVPAGVLIGGLCGMVNGLVITRMKVSPFVATLGMMSIARGLAYYVADLKDIAFPEGVKPRWAKLLQQVHPDTVFNPGAWSLAALAGLTAVFLRFHVQGRYTYAIGSNESTARLCGVGVERTKVLVYTLAGLFAGWAGVLSFANLGGSPSSSQGLELEVIAAVVIGGASLAGGQGGVGGTLLGLLILGLLLNGVRFMGVAVEYRYILIGAVIIMSTALGRLRREAVSKGVV